MIPMTTSTYQINSRGNTHGRSIVRLALCLLAAGMMLLGHLSVGAEPASAQASPPSTSYYQCYTSIEGGKGKVGESRCYAPRSVGLTHRVIVRCDGRFYDYNRTGKWVPAFSASGVSCGWFGKVDSVGVQVRFG